MIKAKFCSFFLFFLVFSHTSFSQFLELDQSSDSKLKVSVSSTQYGACHAHLFQTISLSAYHSFYLTKPSSQYFGFEAGGYHVFPHSKIHLISGFFGQYNQGVSSTWVRAGCNVTKQKINVTFHTQLSVIKTKDEITCLPGLGVSYTPLSMVDFVVECTPRFLYQAHDPVINVGTVFHENYLSANIYIQTYYKVRYFRSHSMVKLCVSIALLTQK